MISVLGLHGSAGHPDFIAEFIKKLAPELPRNSPRGTIADGEGFTFFKRRADRSIPPWN
jgi:phospholipase/carboxylesterase